MTALFLAIGLFVLGIVLNGLFAGYETGFISVDRIRVNYLADEENDPRAQRLQRELKRPEKMLTTVLIGTNVSLIFGIFALSSQISTAWITTLIATPLFLIFAEIIPKSVFRRHPNVLSLVLFPTIRAFEWLLSPLIYPTLYAVRALRWITGNSAESLAPILSTEEDIRHLIDESAARGSIEREEQQMIHSVMNLQKIQAKEIMVPRIDIQAISADASRDELLALFQQTGRTRIPIFRESLDTIVGVANAFDVLLDVGSVDESIARFAKPVLHVPDTKPVDELLDELRQSAQHCAIVIDEYGGTDGLLTLEDVLEEIFGEIRDEHDHEEALIQQVGPNNFVIDTRMPLEELNTATGLAIDDDEIETVGGWVMRVAGRIPLQGEKIKHEGFRITVLEGRPNQISKVRLDILPEARGPASSESPQV